jgi:hypothetical protein
MRTPLRELTFRVDEGTNLARYLVERSFPDGFDLPAGPEGTRIISSIFGCNSDRLVTWIHSYVSSDRKTTFCIYEALSPEAIRLTARANGLPVDRIVEVTVLDPYAFHVHRSEPK